MDYIAIKPLSYDDNLSLYRIKRDLLFFDKISIDPMLYNYFLKQLYYDKLFFDGKKGEQIFNYYQVNFNYLIDNGFIVFTPIEKVLQNIKNDKNPKLFPLILSYNSGLKKFNKDYERLNDKIANIGKEIIEFRSKIEECVTSDGKLFLLGENGIPVKAELPDEIPPKDDFKLQVNKFCEILHQLTLYNSDNLFNKNTISTSVRNHNDKRLYQFENKFDNVLNIVLSRVPIPDTNISFEQIIDFRKDPDSTHKFFRLRNWILDLTKSDLTEKELSEKLEFALSEYETHLKHHRIKYKHTQLETFIGLTFEVAENLVKIKWKEAIKTLFSIRKNEIDFASEESNLKNNEVSYLNKIKEKFDPNSDMEKWEHMIKIKRIR